MTADKRALLEAIIAVRQRMLERAISLCQKQADSQEDVDRAEIDLLEAKLRLLEG